LALQANQKKDTTIPTVVQPKIRIDISSPENSNAKPHNKFDPTFDEKPIT
jgi:hypothetical protein